MKTVFGPRFVPVAGVGRLGAALTEHRVPSVVQTIPGARHAKGYQADALPVTLAWLAGQLG
ncbi:hypothetical protein [Flexivirga meconopsidis]|uniref:hypothetical protein n=1 Tax=Flexivirga meconopsidis TaxID=2977121 RepID=UPI00223EB56F|nr:hypothetical protein [Flexivirga meconopsidis]